MRLLMKRGKEKSADGMFALVEEMLRKTKCLCSLMDTQTVEEAFRFLEDNRLVYLQFVKCLFIVVLCELFDFHAAVLSNVKHHVGLTGVHQEALGLT